MKDKSPNSTFSTMVCEDKNTYWRLGISHFLSEWSFDLRLKRFERKMKNGFNWCCCKYNDPTP